MEMSLVPARYKDKGGASDDQQKCMQLKNK